MQEELLPLFPLSVVLFPRTSLPLHIFEERYKSMIEAAIRERSEFGVVLAAEKGIHNVGCTATVEEVTQRYPDGRFDIVTRGRRRFEILQVNEEQPCLRARVQFFDDEESGAPSPEIRQRALEVYHAIRAVDNSLPEAEALDPQLSFQLSQAIEELDFRQALLRSRSESERMERLAEYLPLVLARRAAIEQVKRVAPRNGHGRHGVKL
ncbi:MAG: LON peptidase substrate-binding domain-containing protein [Bryobacteraceae bacterium]